MILCKFFDENGVDVLKNLRLKVSDPASFNDPFEFLIAVGGNVRRSTFKKYVKNPATIDKFYSYLPKAGGPKNKKEFKKSWKSQSIDKTLKFFEERAVPRLRETAYKQKAYASETLRVICFCQPEAVDLHGEILMWSHYSFGHSGLRITFDTAKINLRSTSLFKIDYKDQRFVVDINSFMVDLKEVTRGYEESIKTKCKAWSYEKEYRWIISLKECFREKIGEKELEFIKIDPSAIVRVDIGINARQSFREAVLNILKEKDFNHVQTTQAKIDDIEFKLNYMK